jgi:diguanylate cyclase (GGDEF)-like protein/PAS domain S-box-containing protein
MSPSVIDLRGYTPDEAVAQNLAESICETSLPVALHSINSMIDDANQGITQKTRTIEIELMHKNGTTIWAEINGKLTLNNNNEPNLFVGSIRDISERRKNQEEIKRLAYSDALTGLANRQALIDKLEAVIKELSISGKFSVLMFIDMDGFKKLNDTYGHKIGDELLVETAIRIKSNIQSNDIAARFGGDEFVVLINELDENFNLSSMQASVLAAKIENSLKKIYHLSGVDYASSASLGYRIFNSQDNLNTILHDADQAMYIVKKRKS